MKNEIWTEGVDDVPFADFVESDNATDPTKADVSWVSEGRVDIKTSYKYKASTLYQSIIVFLKRFTNR